MWKGSKIYKLVDTIKGDIVDALERSRLLTRGDNPRRKHRSYSLRACSSCYDYNGTRPRSPVRMPLPRPEFRSVPSSLLPQSLRRELVPDEVFRQGTPVVGKSLSKNEAMKRMDDI
ncbi:uncharacterized protein RAG0_08138 [Rhynchosporium agropyri]|uniref:Uncharacterized protein n=1 Tax=Rhynchosporium agropyri TaxID=914238 RepID=A0A1E1KPC3_9HELO|nr:uncharacterized protein RAG0_08138 [Rhynchosporium agropyri]